MTDRMTDDEIRTFIAEARARGRNHMEIILAAAAEQLMSERDEARALLRDDVRPVLEDIAEGEIGDATIEQAGIVMAKVDAVLKGTPTEASPERRLSTLMGALADHTATLSDEQILEDAKAEGIDVEAEARQVRAVMLAGVKFGKPTGLTSSALKAIQARADDESVTDVAVYRQDVRALLVDEAKQAARGDRLWRQLEAARGRVGRLEGRLRTALRCVEATLKLFDSDEERGEMRKWIEGTKAELTKGGG